MKNFKEWQDLFGFVHINKNPTVMDSENGALFSAYAISLGLSKNEHYPVKVFSLYHKDKWRGSAKGTGDHFSHDNYLGMLYLQRHYNAGYLYTKFFDFVEYGYWHPRDIILFNYVRGHKWLWPFMIIPSIACIISVLSANKDRTSGTLLTRLRLDMGSLRLTKKICDKIISKKFGNWNEAFKLYFRSEGHPCRELTKG